jgi:hypothetical protein
MPLNLIMTKTTLVRLFDLLGYPAPDDPGPYGPFGPVIHDGPVAHNRGLNAFYPTKPKYMARVTRSVIDQALTMVRFAENLPAPEKSGAAAAASAYIDDYVDQLCPPPPPPPRIPRRWWALDAVLVNPVDLLAAATQFQKAADAGNGNPLAGDFVRAADRMIETGLSMLANTTTETATIAA